MGAAQVLLQICPNPPPEIRVHPGDHPFEWPQSKGTKGSVLSPAPTATLALLPASNLSAQRVSAASQLAGKAGEMHMMHMCLPNLSHSEFYLPFGWVPMVTWASESQVCPSKCGTAPQSAACETDEAHFVTLSQNSTQIWDEHEFWNKFKAVCLGFVAGFVGCFFGWLGRFGFFGCFLSVWHQQKNHRAVLQTVSHPQ